MDLQILMDRMVPEPLTQAERQELRVVLTSTAMLKALRLARKELEEIHTQFIRHKLSTMEGVHDAVKLQGRVMGMGRVIDMLAEIATEPASADAGEEEKPHE
jgi:hypothetical protein